MIIFLVWYTRSVIGTTDTVWMVGVVTARGKFASFSETFCKYHELPLLSCNMYRRGKEGLWNVANLPNVQTITTVACVQSMHTVFTCAGQM